MGILQDERHRVENKYEAIKEDDDCRRYDGVRGHRRRNGNAELQHIRSGFHYTVQQVIFIFILGHSQHNSAHFQISDID